MRNIDKKDVPAVTVPRLALYLRKLRELRARGVERVSSKDLAELIGLNAAQIRKDFSYFGEFGTRGVGYEVTRLVDEITRTLGLDHTWNVVIVGAGLLGTALARYRGFSEQGFRLVGMFDSSATVIGASHGSGRVRGIGELEEFCRAEQVDIAMVTVPASEAQATVERLAARRHPGGPQLRAGAGAGSHGRAGAPGRPVQRAHVPDVLSGPGAAGEQA